jgi:hypothetical protein
MTGVKLLGQAIKSHKSLTALSFKDTDSEAPLNLQKLRASTPEDKADFSKRGYDSCDMYLVVHALPSASHIGTLAFDRNAIGAKGVKVARARARTHAHAHAHGASRC